MPDERPPIEGRAHFGAEGGLRAHGEVLDLDRETDRAVGIVTRSERRRTQYLRELVAGVIILIFAGANVATFAIVLSLVRLDQENIASHLIAPADRIITNQVIMTLLGATAVQIGVIAGIIARYLFSGQQGGVARRSLE